MEEKQTAFQAWPEKLRQRAVESFAMRVFLYKFIKKFHNAWGRRHVRQVLSYFEVFVLSAAAALTGGVIRRFVRGTL